MPEKLNWTGVNLQDFITAFYERSGLFDKRLERAKRFLRSDFQNYYLTLRRDGYINDDEYYLRIKYIENLSLPELVAEDIRIRLTPSKNTVDIIKSLTNDNTLGDTIFLNAVA